MQKNITYVHFIHKERKFQIFRYQNFRFIESYDSVEKYVSM